MQVNFDFDDKVFAHSVNLSFQHVRLQLAIDAEHFVNEPEGGFVAVGDIRYRGLVKTSCALDDSEDAEQPVPVGGTVLITPAPCFYQTV